MRSGLLWLIGNRCLSATAGAKALRASKSAKTQPPGNGGWVACQDVRLICWSLALAIIARGCGGWRGVFRRSGLGAGGETAFAHMTLGFRGGALDSSGGLRRHLTLHTRPFFSCTRRKCRCWTGLYYHALLCARTETRQNAFYLTRSAPFLRVFLEAQGRHLSPKPPFRDRCFHLQEPVARITPNSFRIRSSDAEKNISALACITSSIG